MPKQTPDPPVHPAVTRIELATASPFSVATAASPRRKQPPRHAVPPAQPDAPPEQLLAEPVLRVTAAPTDAPRED